MFLRLLGLVWGATIIVLILAFNSYIGRPGELGLPPRFWPQLTSIPRDVERPTVVLFVDPNCPCTQATLANLERCLARCVDLPATKIVIVRGSPGEIPRGTAQRLATLPRVEFVWDTNGNETKRFEVKTSGEVLVFRSDGGLEFSGGITPGRGHEGDTSGMEAIVNINSGAAISHHEAHVYGCPL